MTIAEVVRQTGLTRKALRVYEERGLVRPRTRTRAGYRLYDAEDMQRLRLVQLGRSLGLSLAECGELVAAGTGEGDTHNELLTIVERKLEETEEELSEIRSLQSTLQQLRDRLARGSGRDGREERRCACRGLLDEGRPVAEARQ